MRKEPLHAAPCARTPLAQRAPHATRLLKASLPPSFALVAQDGRLPRGRWGLSCRTAGFRRGPVFPVACGQESGGGPCQTMLDKPSTAIYVQNLTSDKAVGHQQHHRLCDFLSPA